MEKLNYKEQMIVDHIKRWCLGRENAKTFSHLGKALNFHEREFRKIISHIVNIHNELIGSTSKDGYFFINSEEEFKRVDDELTKRGTSAFRRRKKLRKKWKEKTKGQQRLPLKEFEEVV